MARRIKIRWRRLFAGAILLALAGWLAVVVTVHFCLPQPPPLPADISVLNLKPVQRDGKTYLGKSWAGEREGLPVIDLKGSPLEIGFADGTLMQAKMHVLENDFLKMIQGYVPEHWLMELLKDYVIYRNRHLSDYIPLPYRLEIYGTSLACPDIHPEEGPFYGRLLNYHAAHDVSYMMIDNPFIARSAGCTAFGAWGSATANGHLISGRNFDWEAAEVFSRDRVVEMFEPDGGIPFISLAWAGMTGVVSGMNRAGISVTINGAPSQLPKETATPVAIVAREVLQNAHNLNEALKIVTDAKVFVSTIWLIGSRADGKFVVVEKTPDTTHVRDALGDVIVCPNHFETAGLKDNPRNTNYMATATSVSREKRMLELLQAGDGSLDAPLAVKILRDRDLPGGVFAGNGHRSSLNAFIATHAVVMDLTAGIFWAASPPNGLGKFVAFDVNDFNHELPELAIPADAVLASGEYERTRQAQDLLQSGKQALKAGQGAAALDAAEQAEKLNPGFYENSFLAGRALLQLHRPADAANALKTALAEHPAFLKETQELEKLLHEAGAAN